MNMLILLFVIFVQPHVACSRRTAPPAGIFVPAAIVKSHFATVSPSLMMTILTPPMSSALLALRFVSAIHSPLSPDASPAGTPSKEWKRSASPIAAPAPFSSTRSSADHSPAAVLTRTESESPAEGTVSAPV